MKIYTRTGDHGSTDLANGQRTGKASPRISAIGTLDELNAHLGLSLALMHDLPDESHCMHDERGLILRAQRLLFGIGAWAAAAKQAHEVPEAADTEALEAGIDHIESTFHTAFQGFILPGGCKAAAQLHVARTVCRRAERELLAAGASRWENATTVMAYLNRLSDFLYATARKTNILAHFEEIKY